MKILPLAEQYHKIKNSGYPVKPDSFCIQDVPFEQINEKTIQYLWAEQVFRDMPLQTGDGETVTVNFPGFWNTEAGPDFRQASFYLGPKLRQGDVEIHLYSSDWYRHNHHRDKQYNQVVLHLVGWVDDGGDVITANGNKVPTIILTPFLEKEFEEIDRFLEISDYGKFNARFGGAGRCSQYCLNARYQEQLTQFLEMAGEARLTAKIKSFNQHCQVPYDDLIYRGIMTGLGYQHNTMPFHELAQLVPLRLVRQVLSGTGGMDKYFSLQAFFLYRANLVPVRLEANKDKITEEYIKNIGRVYQQILKTIGPQKSQGLSWRFAGIRPVNYPYRRLAGLSYFLGNHLNEGIAATLADIYAEPSTHPTTQLVSCFNPREEDDYWLAHTIFGGKKLSRVTALVGKSTVRTLEINIIIPFLLFLAKETNKVSRAEILLQRFKEYTPLPANRITRLMTYRLFADKITVMKHFIPTAFEQQALIQIYRDWCAKGFEGCESCGLVRWFKGNN